MKMTGWIQSADFGTKDLPAMDLPTAIQTFAQYDWSGEAELEVNLSQSKEESCPAGFGLTHPNGHRLWIGPTRADACWVIFTRNLNRKLLGLIPLSNPELGSENVPYEMIDDLISEFYDDTSEAYALICSIHHH